MPPGKRRGQCHFGLPKARPGKTRTFRSLSSIFHSLAIVRSWRAGTQRPMKWGARVPIRPGEYGHDDRDAGLVAAVPEPAAPSAGYSGLSAPDGCAGCPACRALTPRRALIRGRSGRERLTWKAASANPAAGSARGSRCRPASQDHPRILPARNRPPKAMPAPANRTVWRAPSGTI
jgi:hypothetical protein